MRRAFLWALAIASAGLALWVLGAALVADKLTGQVFFAILPLVMLFAIAWNGLNAEKKD